MHAFFRSRESQRKRRDHPSSPHTHAGPIAPYASSVTLQFNLPSVPSPAYQLAAGRAWRACGGTIAGPSKDPLLWSPYNGAHFCQQSTERRNPHIYSMEKINCSKSLQPALNTPSSTTQPFFLFQFCFFYTCKLFSGC